MSYSSRTSGQADFRQALLLGDIYNLQAQPASASTVTIETGAAWDSTGTFLGIVSAQLTADITASGANGLDTGAEGSSTWYAVFAIWKADGTAASLLSTSAGSPTMPATYIYFRLVGWVYNDGSSNLVDFVVSGRGPDRWVFYVGDQAVAPSRALSAGTSTTWAAIDCSQTLPNANARIAQFTVKVTGANASYIRPGDSTLAEGIGVQKFNAGTGSSAGPQTFIMPFHEGNNTTAVDYSGNGNNPGFFLNVDGYLLEL